MTEYPKNIAFKYRWRNYQQRVLDELQTHLTDNHLHIIAPPGSGKTILGLEVALRLNKPTLILAPTIAIRNQWVQRFCELFLQTNTPPDWISKDIRSPGFMTVVTYQGLHAACSNQEIENLEGEEETEESDDGESPSYSKSTIPKLEEIVSNLLSLSVQTIVVDEAHHLKNEWWQTLTKVKQKLEPTIVGLTATPPYDVSAIEWQRYIELNGPVDTEISIPELVVEGDLCPHQDYVHFCLPSGTERRNIQLFRENTDAFFREIKTDHAFIEAIKQHPIWQDPTQQLEWIYTNLSHYSACIIFLHSCGEVISQQHLEVIGDTRLKIPDLDKEWLELLLDFYLYEEKVHFKSFEGHRKKLESELRRIGVIDRKKIKLRSNKQLAAQLTSSINKLDAIQDIVRFEYDKLGSTLRLVILSDFIRKEFLSSEMTNDLPLNKSGVIPIFEKLRRENSDKIKIGVLTGSLIIVPSSSVSALLDEATKSGIDQLHSTPLPYDAHYLQITVTEKLKHHIVHVVTQIFQTGEIEVLIGTKSLLGEGWDAPAINSLILASFVGSFVLSNQMRGRAIRSQHGNPDKTGNIWHLVCIDPTMKDGGDDVSLLQRRFRSFVGVSFGENPVIENGMARLNISKETLSVSNARQQNTEMYSYAGDRKNLKDQPFVVPNAKDHPD